jgi:hypothetical protein
MAYGLPLLFVPKSLSVSVSSRVRRRACVLPALLMAVTIAPAASAQPAPAPAAPPAAAMRPASAPADPAPGVFAQGVPAPAGPVAAGPAAADTVAGLDWLAGCWSFTQGDRLVEEQWMRPAGGLMLGMSRTVRAGRPRAVEFVVLRAQGDRVVYEARPEGQAPATFPLASSGAQTVTFANPAHDFPQRIIYRREGDRLSARIEGDTPQGPRGIDYPFVRTACP